MKNHRTASGSVFSEILADHRSQCNAFEEGEVLFIAINQSGYNTNDIKFAYAVANSTLNHTSFEICDVNNTSVFKGVMKNEGLIWNKTVYSINFSAFCQNGEFTLLANNIRSYAFFIKPNIYTDYMIDMMAYYRMQRSATDTGALMDMGDYAVKYGGNPKVTKGYHTAAHLDDAWDPTKTIHYDLCGGWYDAGDYGIYSENQWVTGQMAVTYIENISQPDADVSFDYDKDGIPDIIDELIHSALLSIKMVDAFDGYGYNIQRMSHTDKDDKCGWKHPEYYTDNIIGSPEGSIDDRYAHDGTFANDGRNSKSVEGSAKMAASLAATARALQTAVDCHKITTEQLNNYMYDQKNLEINGKGSKAPINIKEACISRAVKAYDTAKKYDGNVDYPKSNYFAINKLNDLLLWAEVELYLLTKDDVYLIDARTRIMTLSDNSLTSTNYWGNATLAIGELYPHIKAGDINLSVKIQALLTSQVKYFIDSASGTPYGVLNKFGSFGVNEPHVSYVSDAIRYYRLFISDKPDMANKALVAVKKGLDWIFGANPWNIGWVSGIGTNYTKFLHSRLDEDKQGIVLPGAMVSGANMHNPEDKDSESPWYADLSVDAGGTNQWRYNEHSISIQIGLFNSVISLAALNVPSVPVLDNM